MLENINDYDDHMGAKGHAGDPGPSFARISDNVNHPQHYISGGMECIDAIKAATSTLVGLDAFCVGNAMKYMWRWSHAQSKLEDVEKARWYLDYLINKKREELNSIKGAIGERGDACKIPVIIDDIGGD